MNTLHRWSLALALGLSALAPARADDTATQAWNEVFAVFSHPRCAACHVSDEHPRWFDKATGAPKFHGMNVLRGQDGSGFGNAGLRCATCHGPQNAPTLLGPPGAPKWHLAPVEMVWFGRSSAEICAQIKDKARNGDRSLDQIADHVRDDKLVAWGWSPGGEREPAPGSAQKTYDDLKRWIAGGAPCPGA